MNLSIHLPDPLIGKLDAYASAQAKSRSSVVREAVSEYLLRRAAAVWPAELAEWMSTPENANSDNDSRPDGWPELGTIRAIREEANANMDQRGTQT